MVFDKPLQIITEADLQALIDDQVSESKTVEYKEAWPGNTDEDKKEFVADVMAFANTVGGHLIYGIKADDGVPVAVCGIRVSSLDKEILAIEGVLKSHIFPRIPQIEVQPIPLASQPGSYVIILRIPRSWVGPHMMTFKDWSKFVARNSKGKYTLDIGEIRTAFELSGTLIDRIRGFRHARLSKIGAAQTPIPVPSNAATLVLHNVPLRAFDAATRVDVSRPLRTATFDKSLLEPTTTQWPQMQTTRYNFDGLLTMAPYLNPGTGYWAYAQYFHNGSVELVDAMMLHNGAFNRITPISGSECQKRLLDALKRYLVVQEFLGVEPPFFVMVSLLHVLGYKLALTERDAPSGFEIDRSDLIIPEIIIDRFDANLPALMKPVFDTIWNAGGWERAMTYAEDGTPLIT